MLRIVKIVGIALLVLVVAVAGTLGYFTLSERGRAHLAGLISETVSSADMRIGLEGVDGVLGGRLRVDRVTVADREGTWLELDDVALDWSPLALLSRRFEAARLSVAGVEVSRRPLPAQSPAPPSNEPFRLPVDIDVAAIELPVIVLGEPVAGEAARLSAEGALAAEGTPLRIDTTLRARRTDERDGQLDAVVAFVPDENRLDVEIRGSEAAGGVIANLLALPGAPPVAIVVTGSGPAADWRGEATFAVDGVILTRLNARHQKVEGGSRIEASGEGEFQRFVPEIARPLLSGETVFDVAGTFREDGQAFEIEGAMAESNTIRAAASGIVDPDGASNFILDLSARGAPVPLALGDGLMARLDGLSISVEGEGRTPAILGRVQLAGLTAPATEIGPLSLELRSERFAVDTMTGPVNVVVTADSVDFDNPNVDPLLAGPITISAEADIGAQLVTIANGVVDGAALDGTVAGTIGRGDGALDLAVTARLVSEALPAATRRPLGEDVDLSARIVRPADGSISVRDLTLESGQFSIAGSAMLSGGAVTADLRGNVADLSVFTPQATGAADFAATVSGPLARPQVDMRLTGERIVAAGRVLEGVEITADAVADIADPQANVTVKGTLEGIPVEGTAALVSEGGVRRIEDLNLSLAGNSITGGFDLGEGFLPSGSLSLSVSDISRLAALGLDDVTGTIDGNVALTVEDGRPAITIDGTIAEVRRGDIVARGVAIDAVVADYVTAPAVSGHIRAEEVQSGEVVARDVDFDLSREGSWTRFDGSATVADIPVTAAGRVEAAGVTTLELDSATAILPGIEARLARPGRIVVEDGTARLEGLALGVGGGTIDVAGSAGAALDLDIRIADLPAATANAFVANLGAEGTLSGTARVTGEPAAPQAAFDLDLAGASVAASRAQGVAPAEISADGRFANNALSFAADARIAGIDHPQATTGPVTVRLASEGFDTGTLSGPLAVTVEAERVETANETARPLLAGPVTASADLAVAADAIRITNGRIAGEALDATVSGTIARPDFAVAMELAATADAEALPAAARGVLGDELALSLAFSRSANGAIGVENLRASSGPLQLTGSAALADEAVRASITGALADLALVAPQARGAVNFSLEAEGPLSAPRLSARLTGERIEAAGRPIEGLEFTATGVADIESPEAQVSLAGTVGGLPLRGDGVLSTEGGNRRVEGLVLTLGENRVAGDLVLDEAFLPTGTLELSIPDVGPLAALALDEASGAVVGTVDFTVTDGRPRVAVDARIAEFRRGDLSGRGVVIDADVNDYIANPTVSGRVQAQEIRSGETTVRGIDLNLSREGPWTRFDGGATVADIPARAAGRVQVADGVTRVELDSASATVQGIAASLARPSAIVIRDGTTTLDRLALGIGGGTVEVTGTVAEALALDVRLSGVPAATANSFAPGLAAEGAISGTARVRGSTAAPDATFDLDWANAATSQTRSAGLGPVAVSASGNYAGNRLSIRTDVSGAGGLSLSGGGTVGIAAPQPLDLSFTGRAPFSILSARLAAQGLALDGGADFDLSIGGNASSPAVTGSIRTSAARFVDAGSGIAVQDIAADIGLTATTATLRSFTGTLSTGGAITGSGTVGLAPGSGFPADLRVGIANGRYTDGRIVTANFSGDLTVTGPLAAQPVLGGTVNLDRTVITLPERLPGTLARLDVRHRGAPAAVNRQAEALRPATASGSGGGLALDLTVNAPQEIFVRGRGLDAELGGSLRLTGPVAAPVASGVFTLRRGRLSILGKRLDFSRGTLGFGGSLVPTLDLAASTTASNQTTVTVSVTGQANDPAFTFSSSPVLPQDEILAQLIFGRSMSNLSPLQIAQLAEAAAQLTGIGGSTSLLDRIREGLGVDDLDIRTDEATGDTSVAVGRYLNDRTYLSIEKGSNPGSGKARIDLEVGRGLKLRGEAADDGNTRGGIFYEREY